MEPLMAVTPDIKVPWRKSFWDLTDIEEGRHQQPKAMAVEEDSHGGEQMRGGGCRRAHGETVEDRSGGEEKRKEEDKGADSIAVLPPALSGVTAGDDAYDSDQTGGWDVEAFKEQLEVSGRRCRGPSLIIGV